MESTCSAPFKNRETCETENKSAHATASFNTNRYNTTRSKIGKKINNKTTIPIAPVALFNTCKLPNTVAYASETAPPTIGTKLETTYFVVLVVKPSAALLTML